MHSQTKMSCKEQAMPLYLNVSLHPSLTKQKAQNLDLKKWETSLKDFKSKEPSEFNKKLSKNLNLCKKKINEIPKKVFFDNSHKFVKKKFISDKNIIETDLSSLNSQPFCSLDPFLQNRKTNTRNANFNIHAIEKKMVNVRYECKSKLEQVPCVFSKKVHRALKRKSMSKYNAIENDFLCSNSQSNFPCYFSVVRSSQKEKKTYSRQNPSLSFNMNNIEAVFEKKPLDVRYVDVHLCHSNPNVEKFEMFEQIKNVKELSKKNVIIPEEFFPDNSRQISLKSATSSSIISTTECVGFKMTENVMDANCQSIKIDHQNLNKNLFKIALISTLSTGCNVSPIGVGSNWIHSLEQIKDDHSQYEEKKKIQSLLIGGYCELILKFQRQESLEKAIFEHRNGFKASSVGAMRINSIIYDYEIIVAECCVQKTQDSSVHNAEKLTNEVSSSSTILNESRTCITFFQKSSFCKQQMEIGKSFIFSQPWYLIHLQCFKSPVLIGKYFKTLSSTEGILQDLSNKKSMKENVENFQSMEINHCNSVVDCYSRKTFKSKQKEDIFFMLKGRINIRAKIQRIWNHIISDMRLTKLLSDRKMYRLLLQTRNGIFFLLNISSHHYLDWLTTVEIHEGHFYLFENLNVSHRLEIRRHPTLYKYLQNLSKKNLFSDGKQNFVYQLFIGEMTKKPSRMIEADLPPFLSFSFESLSNLLKNSAGRASCKVNILLQYCSILYVSDESFSYSGNIKYVKVFLPEPAVTYSRSQICIMEALILGGDIYLDEYSQISYLPLPNESLPTFNFQDGQLQLRHDSKVADIAIVKGNIINVDENNASVWLQCSYCMKENLVQNTNEVIFCEDCCLVVHQPILKVKMIVTVASESLQNVLSNIELSSPTIKRILSLKENSYPPQCDVSDVLGKEIGPLLCYIKSVDLFESHALFYLNEVRL